MALEKLPWGDSMSTNTKPIRLLISLLTAFLLGFGILVPAGATVNDPDTTSDQPVADEDAEPKAPNDLDEAETEIDNADLEGESAETPNSPIEHIKDTAEETAVTENPVSGEETPANQGVPAQLESELAENSAVAEDEEIAEISTVKNNSNGISLINPRNLGVNLRNSKLYPVGDFDGNGLDDLLSVDASGKLYLHARNLAGSFNSPKQIGSGWAQMKILGGGDYHADGRTDVIALNRRGELFVYTGNGKGGFLHQTQIGKGWGEFREIILAPKGRAPLQIIANTADKTYVYYSNPNAGFKPRVSIEYLPGLSQMAPLTDTNQDSLSELLQLNESGATIWQSKNAKGFSPTKVDLASAEKFTLIETLAPRSKDEPTKVLVQKLNGDLVEFELAGFKQNPLPASALSELPKPVVTDFKASKAIISGKGWPQRGVLSMAYFNNDGYQDLGIIRNNGDFYLYEGKAGGWRKPRKIGTQWNGLKHIQAGVDFDSDGRSDVIAVDFTGKLRLYPGNGSGGFMPMRQIGHGFGDAKKFLVLRQGPNGYPAILWVDSKNHARLYQTNGKAKFGALTSIRGADSDLNVAFAGDDFDKDGRSDLLVQRKNGQLGIILQGPKSDFKASRNIGKGWQFPVLLSGVGSAKSTSIWAITKDGKLLQYSMNYLGPNNSYSMNPIPKPIVKPKPKPKPKPRPKYAPKVQVNGSWLTHPIQWVGQPDSVTCGPTSMYMVLRYLDAGRSKYDGQALSISALRGRNYANVGSGFSGGTSWEQHRLSLGLNRWRGNQDYQQKAFPTGYQFRDAVVNSFYTGRPVLVDTIENYGGPHYNGHFNGYSSHIIVAYRYNVSNGVVGFKDPGGPGSAITGYSKYREFDYNDAVRFGNNFLGDYGGGGHGMVY